MAAIWSFAACGCNRETYSVGYGYRASSSSIESSALRVFGVIPIMHIGWIQEASAQRCHLLEKLIGDSAFLQHWWMSESHLKHVLHPSNVLVKWGSFVDKTPEPPTAVLLHGILGCRKNWGSFARRLAREFPHSQSICCHGDSAILEKRSPHTVASAALDVLKLVGQLKVTPRVLVGHSFGGNVALSMVEQAAKPLSRPVRILDATPGKVRPGGDGEDHPAELISFLSKLRTQVFSKKKIVNALIQEGFSKDVSQWVVTNLRETGSPSSRFSWAFDLKGIANMYKSYEGTNLWIVEDVPQGFHRNFLRAERSLHRWAVDDIQRIHAAEEIAANEGAGVEMHVLEDAGHWAVKGGLD